MPLFFVLSGFVIHYNYSDSIEREWRRGVLNFFVARFSRLYPLYIFCIVFTVVLGYSYTQLPSATFQVLPYYLTMTQTWMYQVVGGSSLVYQFGNTAVMTAVSWSIATEWFFYCAYPVMCLGLVRLRTLRATLFAAAIVSVVATLLLAAVAIYDSEINRIAVAHFGLTADIKANSQNSFLRWLVYFSPYSRILEFSLGCLCANAILNMQRMPPDESDQKIGVLLTTLSVAATIVAYLTIYATTGVQELSTFRPILNVLGMSFGLALPCALLIFCCARYDNVIIRTLSHPILVRCGEVSFSLYLLHLMVIYAFRWEAAPVTSFRVLIGDTLRFMLMVASAIGLSFVTWRTIEVPAQRWIRRTFMLRPSVVQSGMGAPEVIQNFGEKPHPSNLASDAKL